MSYLCHCWFPFGLQMPMACFTSFWILFFCVFSLLFLTIKKLKSANTYTEYTALNSSGCREKTIQKSSRYFGFSIFHKLTKNQVGIKIDKWLVSVDYCWWLKLLLHKLESKKKKKKLMLHIHQSVVKMKSCAITLRLFHIDTTHILLTYSSIKVKLML